MQFPRILPGDPPHGLLLGWRQDKEPISIWDNRDEGHLITVAPTGAGKGVSCIIPALLSWRGPAIVIDPRGENYAVTAKRRRQLGQQVHVLDPFGITDEADPSAFNPLQMLNHGALDHDDDVAAIANLLVDPRVHKSKQDPFWTERATALITLAINEAFAHLRHRRPVTLADAALLIRCADTSYRNEPKPDQLTLPFAEYIKDVANGWPPSFCPSIAEFGTHNTRASIFSSAASHIGFLRSAAIRQSLREGLDPAQITDGTPLTIYVVIPYDKMETHAGLLRLWIGSFLMCMARRKRRLDIPTLFLIDEAAQLGQLAQLRTALTLFRGYSLRVWTFWQDMAQLRNTYSDWESVLNNSTTQQFFSPATPFARRLLDDYLCGAAPPGAFKHDKAVLVTRGETRMVTRTDYRSERLFAGLTTPNPYYPAPSAELIPFTASR